MATAYRGSRTARRFSEQDKAAILAELAETKANAKQIAARYGITAKTVYVWLRQRRLEFDEEPHMLPKPVTETRTGETGATSPETIEISYRGTKLVISGDVDTSLVTALLEVLKSHKSNPRP